MVTGVLVKEVSGTSVEVSWEALDILGVSKYVVTYSLMQYSDSNTVKSKEVQVLASERSVLIQELASNKNYQFQVHAEAVVHGQTILGSKSSPVNITLKTGAQTG